MTTYDWHFRREPGTDRTVRVRIARTTHPAPVESHRWILGEERDEVLERSNLVFRTVRGKSTYADLALRTPNTLSITPLRPFYSTFDEPTTARAQYAPSSEWLAFQEQMSVAGSPCASDTHSLLLETCTIEPDRRLGTASIVPSDETPGALDAMITASTSMNGSAARTVGEMLEIWALNALYKPAASDSLVITAVGLLDFAPHPEHVWRTWHAHLARTLESESSQWPALIRALDLAHAVLGRLWAQSYGIPTASTFADLRALASGRRPS